MGLPHIEPGEVVSLGDLKSGLPSDTTVALMKTDSLEAIRMVLPAGKEIAEHSVPGEITVQCLSGKLTFFVEGEPRTLDEGQWLFLSGGTVHSLSVLEDCTLLVTILRPGSGRAA